MEEKRIKRKKNKKYMVSKISDGMIIYTVPDQPPVGKNCE